MARRPTPLDELANLSGMLGVRILAKREDLTGLAFGGNKTRELDFFIGDAVHQGADIFIAGGGAAQSNHAVQCAAAARRAGMIPVMVLHRYRADDIQGNLLLDHLLGTDLRLVDVASVDSAIAQRTKLHQTMRDVAEEYRTRGHRPYVLPSSFHPLGAIGYVDCMVELAGQLQDRSIEIDTLYLTSAGATQVGLALGAKHMQCGYPIFGINYSTGTEGLGDRLVELGTKAAERLGIATRLEANDVPNESFAGPGYGVASPEGLEAIRLLATLEGMFLDPVYSAKGMAGLIAHIRAGRVPKGATVVFLHTGGLPAIFSYNKEILSNEQAEL